MFLDEKLYKHFTENIDSCETTDDFESLHNSLFRICEDDWKPRCYLNMPGKELKACIDRAFRSWDIFIERLTKEENPWVEIIGKYGYKRTFMYHEGLKKFYLKL